MPLLAYCMMEAAAGVAKPVAGVGGEKVEEVRDSGLRCFFSRLQSGEELSRIPAVESALSFHQVLQTLFSQAGLIPFRFPTVVEDEEALLRFLREHAAVYSAELGRLRHMAQMEIHIREGREEASGSLPASGREYLEGRQKQAAELKAAVEKLRQAGGPWVREWRQRSSGQGMRCYALLPRDAVGAFQQAIRAVSQTLPGARLSGPWPPAEFVEIKDS
ncbi:MAG TPA: GvpL/GvpF family gas vesicle protein [Terriglobales bacterium]|nr:GvpL/GvpF family gas vesicle protein [Terriglobales bacterium]